MSDALRAQEQRAQTLVDQISQQQFLGATDSEILSHVSSELEIEPLTLHEDRQEMDQVESQMDVSSDYRRNPFRDEGPINVPSMRISVSIPFSGNEQLWRLAPNPRRTSATVGEISGLNSAGIGQLTINMELPTTEDAAEFKRELESTLDNIRFSLDTQRNQIAAFNASLPRIINDAIAKRRKNLEQHAKVRNTLNIPLKRRPGTPDIKPIQVKRKLIRPLPPAPSQPEQAAIREDDYEHILSVIRHGGRTFEATPGTFAVHDEEELRDIITAHLNGHYQGDATGEAFRVAGKTDIRIEYENRAAFVAECKVWRGQKQLPGALDQLLSYLTWRDGKAALVIFNKDVSGFVGLQSQIPEILRAHKNFERMADAKAAGEWRFLFRSEADSGRHVTVHVFFFNLYVKK